jgi:acyl-CoA oxidase
MPLTGITLGDCGKKLGLDGVDNGFIIFNNFRIPRLNLLNKFSHVAPDGTFETEIPNSAQRFGL